MLQSCGDPFALHFFRIHLLGCIYFTYLAIRTHTFTKAVIFKSFLKKSIKCHFTDIRYTSIIADRTEL